MLTKLQRMSFFSSKKQTLGNTTPHLRDTTISDIKDLATNTWPHAIAKYHSPCPNPIFISILRCSVPTIRAIASSRTTTREYPHWRANPSVRKPPISCIFSSILPRSTSVQYAEQRTVPLPNSTNGCECTYKCHPHPAFQQSHMHSRLPTWLSALTWTSHTGFKKP